jgi:hypothetical protein
MHVGEAAVHHISEEDDCVGTLALRDVPRLAQIHVDEDPGYGPEERAALRVRPVIENLRIGDEEDVSCLSVSLDDRVGQRQGDEGGNKRRGGILLDPANDSVHLQRRICRFRARG